MLRKYLRCLNNISITRYKVTSFKSSTSCQHFSDCAACLEWISRSVEVVNNSLHCICVLPSSSRPLICSSFSLMISIVSLEFSLVESSSRKPFISCGTENIFDTKTLDAFNFGFGRQDRYVGLVVKNNKNAFVSNMRVTFLAISLSLQAS